MDCNYTNDDLVAMLRSGDPTAATEIINRHHGLVVGISRKVAGTYHFDSEELESFAIFNLVKVVNNAPKKLFDNNITSFIAQWTKLDCRNFCRNERRLGQRHDLDENHLAKRDYHFDSLEIHECIDRLPPVEREILKLREQGYTDLEIGAFFDYSERHICRRRQAATDLLEEIIDA